MLAPGSIDTPGSVSVTEMATTIAASGEASVEYYTNLLSNVMYVNYADEPGSTNRTVLFELVDDRGFLISAKTVVRIIPTNDPAGFDFRDRVVSFDEMTRTPVYLFSPTDSLTDPDGDTLTWITVEIRPSIDEMDVLSVDTGTSDLVQEIRTNNDSNTVLTIAGYANFSVYKAVLRTLTFSNPSPGLNLGNRSIHIVTFDGETESPPTVITIVINAFDDSPVCYFNSMVSLA